ncbi:hypothetical protein BDA99DRAFT_606806 [Phascolomyces articulosus]|uniref:Uncharacterized protein n=1 Tax=Phascolomyces articulosus TaxID=60185 RepID=A0AAD5K6D6_9FUNG|nr:hypothetical protein BDA99DRAFT_606806 [Phascolomyces articulosus]
MIDMDDEGDEYEEYARAHPAFREEERYDFVQLEDKTIVQVLGYFLLSSDDQNEEEFVCLVWLYKKMHTKHASGFQVIEPEFTSKEKKPRKAILPLFCISRLVHVIQNFPSGKGEHDGYNQYLVNHDINPDHWAYGAQSDEEYPYIPLKQLQQWPVDDSHIKE